SKLPAALGDIAIKIANNVIGGLEGMINFAIDGLNKLVDAADAIPGIDIGRIGHVDLGRVDNPFSGEQGDVGKIAAEDFIKAMAPDYAGQAFDAISKRAQKLANATDKAGGAMKAANDNAKAFKD